MACISDIIDVFFAAVKSAGLHASFPIGCQAFPIGLPFFLLCVTLSITEADVMVADLETLSFSSTYVASASSNFRTEPSGACTLCAL